MSLTSNTSRWLCGGFGLLLMFGLANCAQEKGTVDRIQHNVFEKSLLNGEWYFRMTVTDAPFDTGYTMLGDSGKLERGVFDIQEKYLYFYRTYEFSENSEIKGMKSDTDTPYVDSDGMGRGIVAVDISGQPISCAKKGDAISFCREQTNDDVALCGQATDFKDFDLTAEDRVCITPTLFVYRGAPLAAWPIEGHFDIIWDYNPTTGERRNVRMENSQDRMWYERSYIRVDWSSPDIQSYEILSMFHWFQDPENNVFIRTLGDVTLYSTYEGEADEPENQPVVQVRVQCKSDSDCNGPAHCVEGLCDRDYMDFSTKHILEPPLTYSADLGGMVPLCYFYPFYAEGFYECSSEEIRMRTAFLKVDAKDDYQPLDYDDRMLRDFGYFRAERQKYDEEFGSTYSGVIRKAAMHRIWEHYLDADGNVLPMSERTPQPIVYYMNQNADRRIAQQSLELANEWSEPFDTVVRFYKPDFKEPMFVLCENNNEEAREAILSVYKQFHPDDWQTRLTDPESGELRPLRVDDLTAADSGVNANDMMSTILKSVGGHTLVDSQNQAFPGYTTRCLDMDTPKRTGDLRYNLLWAITSPTQIGLYGFGPPSLDPLTGEIINANAYNYVAAMELGAARALLTVEMMIGTMNYHDLQVPWFIRLPAKHVAAQGGLQGPNMDDQQAMERASQLVSPEIAEDIGALGLDRTDNNWAQARLNIIAQDPTLERMLVDDSVRMLFRDTEIGADAPLSDEALNQMSLRQFANHRGYLTNLRRQVEASKRTLYLEEFVDNAILGLAREYAYRFNSEACQTAAERTQEDGLFFDFEQFRRVGEACTVLNVTNDDGWVCTNLCDAAATEQNLPNAAGQTCAPCDNTRNNEVPDCSQYYRWVNDCTAGKLLEQVRQLIWQYEDLDPYMYYGPDALWADVTTPEVAKTQQALRGIFDDLRSKFRLELLQRIYKGVALHEVGHTFGLRHNFEASTDTLNYPERWWNLRMQPVDPGNPTEFKDANWDGTTWIRETTSQAYQKMRQLQYSSVMDYGAKFNEYFEGLGHYDHAAIKYAYGDLVEVFEHKPDYSNLLRYLKDPRQDDPSNYGLRLSSGEEMEDLFKVVHFTELPNMMHGIAPMYQRRDVRREDVADNDQVVPYRFCGEELAGKTPFCQMNDAGADPFEIVVNALDDYEHYWIFNGYSRDSVLFWPEQYYTRVKNVFNMVKMQYQYWAVNYAHFNKDGWWDRNFPEEPKWEANRNGGLAGSLASIEMFNTMAAALARPAPAYYGFNSVHQAFEQVTDWNQGDLNCFYHLEEDTGARPIYPEWDYSGYIPQPWRAGAIYDRMAALEVLTDPTTDFAAIDEAADTQTYLVNAYTMFPSQTLNLLGGLMTTKVDAYGWCVYQNCSGGDPNGPPTDVVIRDFLQNQQCPPGYKPMFPEPLDYVFPTTKYRMPMLAAYYGMSLLINNYQRSFLDETRIFLKGDEHAMWLPDDVEKVEFKNPLSGKIYVAYKVGVAGEEFEPAYYLVKRAADLFAGYEGRMEELASAYPYSEMEYLVGLLELVRGMNAIYDYTDAGYGNLLNTGTSE